VVATYADRVRLIALETNGGGSRARNRGAAEASGDFVMFLDSDDLIAPETLSGLVEAIHDSPGSIGICRWDRLRAREGEWTSGPADVPLPDPAADPLREWLDLRWVPPCAVLWRRDVLERTGGWDEELSYNDDGDLMMRAFLGGARMALAADGLAHYRDHGSTRVTVGTDLSSERRVRSGLRVLEKVHASLAEAGRLRDYAAPLGAQYQLLAMYAFQNGHHELGRGSLRVGRELAGPRLVSYSRSARLVERIIGLEGKERLAHFLASGGLMTRGRRILTQRLRASRRG
jgi:glycosyltransferase involved in cell wall biosynthesis